MGNSYKVCVDAVCCLECCFCQVKLLGPWEHCRVPGEGFCHVECLDAQGSASARSLVCRVVSMHRMSIVFEVFLEVILVKELDDWNLLDFLWTYAEFELKHPGKAFR